MKKEKKKLRTAGWWQSVRQKVHSSKEWTQTHVEELHQKQESYGEREEHEEKEGRITFFTAIRIIMAELGETEYWQTLWQLIWRPGYVMSDFINGKGRRYLKPFQLLIGTTILLALALAIVPAKVEKGETLESQIERKLSEEARTPEVKEKMKPIWTFVGYIDEYRQWKSEHMAVSLIVAFIMPAFFTWLLFRKSPRRPNEFVQAKEKQVNYNFPEILTIEIFVAAQLQMINTVWVLIVGWTKPTIALDPFAFPSILASAVMFIDYQQLFCRKWYDTLWRTLVCAI